jgi:hypothetical protein
MQRPYLGFRLQGAVEGWRPESGNCKLIAEN